MAKYSILDQDRLWDDWALPRATAYEMIAHLERNQPRVILECGSGLSTVLLAEYAKERGALVTSLEHSPQWYTQTRRRLTAEGLLGYVNLLQTEVLPAPPILSMTNANHGWYNVDQPTGDIDFVLIDGPPQSLGRHAAMYAINPYLNRKTGFHVWLDDALREPEQDAIKMWQKDLGLNFRTLSNFPRGLAVCTDDFYGHSRVDSSMITVTLLTGFRPELLNRTIANLRNYAPGLLETAHVKVLCNGGDGASAQFLAQQGWVDQFDAHSGIQLPVGAAVSRLMSDLPDRPYLMHLEDDWELCTTYDFWLGSALIALEDENVKQVRLRHRGESVRDYNMSNGKKIIWERATSQYLIGNAHYTLNPSIMRTEDVLDIWPAHSEARAMHKFRGMVAQLNPGAFWHIGKNQSLEGHKW